LVTPNQTLWVGTDYGLAKYTVNGDWTVYTTNDFLTDNKIKALAMDAEETLWIGTFNGGLQALFLDGSVATYTTSNSDLPDNFIRCINIDNDQNVYMGTPLGLTVFDTENWTNYSITSADILLNNVSDIALQNDDLAWLGTVNGGLIRYDRLINNFTDYTTFDSDIPDNTVLSIAIDDLGNKWLATVFHGVVRFDGTAFETYSTSTTAIATNGTTLVKMHQNNADVLIGTVNEGLIIAQPKDDVWQYLQMANSEIPSNYITALAFQNYSVFWLGTKEGLVQVQYGFAVGINDITTTNINTSPNPTTGGVSFDGVTIQIPTKVEVFAVNGQLQLANTLTSNTLQLNSLPNGLYYVRLYHKKRTYTAKVVLAN